MSNDPVLLFLHGVGEGDLEDAWQVALSGALVRIGYPALQEGRWIAPKYAYALRNGDGKLRIPPITVKQPRRTTRVQTDVPLNDGPARWSTGSGSTMPDPVGSVGEPLST